MKVAILIAISMAMVGGASFYLWTNNSSGFVTVTHDKNNACGWKDGKITSSSLAAPDEVKLQIPKAQYAQFMVDAAASGKCIY